MESMSQSAFTKLLTLKNNRLDLLRMIYKALQYLLSKKFGSDFRFFEMSGLRKQHGDQAMMIFYQTDFTAIVLGFLIGFFVMFENLIEPSI